MSEPQKALRNYEADPPDLLDEARRILSGESMMLATNAHLTAVVQHFVGLLREARTLLEMTLEDVGGMDGSFEYGVTIMVDRSLRASIATLKAWEAAPLPDDAEKRQALKGE